MNLKLEFPPEPQFAAKHAAIIVDAMKANEGIELDYTLSSLSQVDAVLMKLHQAGATIDRIPSILFRLGCYVGEVMIRKLPEAKWADPKGLIPTGSENLFPFIVIAHKSGAIWAPINKTFAVLDNPSENSVHFSCKAEIAAEEIRVKGSASRPSSHKTKEKKSFFGRLFSK